MGVIGVREGGEVGGGGRGAREGGRGKHRRIRCQWEGREKGWGQ